MKLLIGADLVPTSPVGDIPGGISERAFTHGDLEALFSDVLPLMRAADRVLVNLECALTDSDHAIPKIGPNLKASPACAATLKRAGISDVALANNHVFDYGIEGLKDTLSALDSVGIPYMGVGMNDTDSRQIYYIEENGVRVAVVNVCEHEYTYALSDRMGANPFDPFLTMADIRHAKKTADFVVVLYHGGKENCRYPSPRLRNACREMVHNGADAVITQHSHCIGCYESYEGAHILYGQGNFHFALAGENEMWNTGLLVELEITDRMEMVFHPFEANGITVSLAKGERYKALMEELASRNEELQNGLWRQRWTEFCHANRGIYDWAAENVGRDETEEARAAAVEHFAHYLDCEAHTDVWRELYPTRNRTNEK